MGRDPSQHATRFPHLCVRVLPSRGSLLIRPMASHCGVGGYLSIPVPAVIFLAWLPGYLFALGLLTLFLVAWLSSCWVSLLSFCSLRVVCMLASLFRCWLPGYRSLGVLALVLLVCGRSPTGRVRSGASAIAPWGPERLKQQCSRPVWSTGLIKYALNMYYKLKTTCYLYAWVQSLRCQLLHPHGCLRGS